MNHRLAYIQIKNLKSIKDEEFPLSGFTPLIGVNNVGKSNILLGCKWLFDGGVLRQKSFCSPNSPVEVIGTVTGISQKNLEAFGYDKNSSVYKCLLGNKLVIKRVQQYNQKKSTLFFKSGKNSWKQADKELTKFLHILFAPCIEIDSMDDPKQQNTEKIIEELLSHINDTSKYFKRTINSYLETFFPGTRISFEDTGRLTIFDDHLNQPRRIDEMGNGAKRCIQMALLKYLAHVTQKGYTRFSKTLILIDEPELYLHPQAIEQVRIALKDISQEGFQVIFATHSAAMINSGDVNGALLVRKDENKGTYAKKRFQDAIRSVVRDAPSQLEMMFTLSNSNQILFAERVLLIEGKTELRILPVIYEMLTRRTLGYSKMALVNQDSASNTKKSIKVLRAMDIPAKAIVDLDYVFTHGVQGGYIKRGDPDYQTCLKLLPELAKKHGFKLDENGLPTNKKSNMSASMAFVILAKSTRAKKAINSLHKKFLKKGVWVWKKGAIEDHLGIKGKNEHIWSGFIEHLKIFGLQDQIKDFSEVKKLMEWIDA